MTQPCSNVLVKKNPYKINLFNTVCSFRTATGLRTVTGHSPGLYNKFVNICFWPTDPVLLLASETFRKWAVGKQTEENQIWLEKNFMQKFQDHFTPVDCPQITLDDLVFNYYGDSTFDPNSLQGVIAETSGETQIKWIFKIATDGGMPCLQIHYD